MIINNKGILNEFLNLIFICDDFDDINKSYRLYSEELRNKIENELENLRISYGSDMNQYDIAEIFYLLLCHLLLKKNFNYNNLLEWIFQLKKGNGFSHCLESFKSRFPKFSRSTKLFPFPVEVFSTCYALLIINQLKPGALNIEDLKNMVKILRESQQESGFIYSKEYSNTKLERRFDEELLLQTYLALVVLTIFSERTPLEDFFQETSTLITSFLEKKKDNLPFSLTAIYHLIIILKICSYEFNDDFWMRINVRLQKYYESNTCMFYDYILSQKTDERMGSRSLTHLDVNTPLIHSTILGYVLHKIIPTRFWVINELKNVSINDISMELMKGKAIKIKNFKPDFGPKITSFDLFLIIVFPSIYNELKKI